MGTRREKVVFTTELHGHCCETQATRSTTPDSRRELDPRSRLVPVHRQVQVLQRLKLNCRQANLKLQIDCRWLVIYDNVESADMLMPYWPGSSQGKSIITTRNHSLAFEPASSSLEVPSWDAQTGSQFLLFLLKKSIGCNPEAEGNSALALSERLSGHALAISHITGLIYDGEYSIQEFVTIYLRNPYYAHAANELVALWDFSFKCLDKNSLSLLGVISFLMPDAIPQEFFEASVDREFPKDLVFCSDDFR